MPKTTHENRPGRVTLIGAAVLTTLAMGQAQAVASFYSFSEATLSLSSAMAEDDLMADSKDLTLFASPYADGMTAVSGPGADAYIDPFAGSSVPGLFGMPTYEFYAYAETGGYAMDPAPSAAEASAYAGYTIDIDNAGSTGYTIFGELSYVLDAEAFVDTPSLEDAYSEVTVSLVDELGTVLFEDVFGFTAGPLDGFGDGGTVMPPSVGVEFFVAAGDYKTLTLEVTSMGEASAVVPLPAAAWLFGAAILGMAGFVTRRNNA